jgi:hypothetical protein
MQKPNPPGSPPYRGRMGRHSPRGGAWPLINWIALAAVLLGVGLALVGISRALQDEETDPGLLESPVRTVVSGVRRDATSGQGIDQQHAVRTSRGRIVLGYVDESGLRLVSDQSNQGRAWRTPVAVGGVRASSFAMAIDANDDIHLVHSPGLGVFYVRLRETQAGWIDVARTTLDPGAVSPVLDIAFDAEKEVAHVVWTRQDEAGGQAPVWAALSPSGDILARDDLAAVGSAPVLVNIAVGPDSRVIATFGGGAQPLGWSSRVADASDPAQTSWNTPERLRVEDKVSAASLEVDSSGTAHLVLRDEGNVWLTYFRRTERAGWTSGEAAVVGKDLADIGSPSVALDPTSRIVYLFYETDEFQSDVETRVAINDPVSGWEGPFRISADDGFTRLAPRSLPAGGGALVFWTRLGDKPAVEVARVVAP